MARADRVFFAPRHQLVAVHVSINGLRDFLLVVDTGAARMVISSRAARRLGLDLAHPIRTEALVGVGQTRPLPVIRLNAVQVGGSAVANLEASVLDLPPVFQADGLIGLPFLRRFRVTIEFDTRSLVLRALPLAR